MRVQHEMLRDDLTEPVIGGFHHVYNELGPGFLESVYEGATVVALRRRGLRVERQVPLVVHYGGEPVGRFYADLVVEDAVLLELKACRALEPAHEAQVLNYLRATSIEVGLILHFGPAPAVRRLILTNDRKLWYARARTSQGDAVREDPCQGYVREGASTPNDGCLERADAGR